MVTCMGRTFDGSPGEVIYRLCCALEEAATRLDARGHRFGAREARKAAQGNFDWRSTDINSDDITEAAFPVSGGDGIGSILRIRMPGSYSPFE